MGLVRETVRYRGALTEFFELEGRSATHALLYVACVLSNNSVFCALCVAEFPFDRQDLSIVLTSTHPSSEMVFVSPPIDKVRVAKEIKLPDWDVVRAHSF